MCLPDGEGRRACRVRPAVARVFNREKRGTRVARRITGFVGALCDFAMGKKNESTALVRKRTSSNILRNSVLHLTRIYTRNNVIRNYRRQNPKVLNAFQELFVLFFHHIYTALYGVVLVRLINTKILVILTFTKV